MKGDGVRGDSGKGTDADHRGPAGGKGRGKGAQESWEEPAMAKRKGKPDSFRGPLPLDRKRLGRLPQTFDVWQVDARPVAAAVRAEGRTIQPWIILAVSRTAGHILAYE